MPEPQIASEIGEKAEVAPIKREKAQICDEKESLPSESGDEKRLAEAAERIPLDLDSYNFDAFISKMRHDSCKPVLESVKK
jgi:hypothetical protein